LRFVEAGDAAVQIGARGDHRLRRPRQGTDEMRIEDRRVAKAS
jgi:hypothetical protein